MTLKQYTVNVLIGIDQLANAIFKGDPDETISSRLGKIKVKHNGKIPFRRYPLRNLIDRMLEWIDPGHSVDAIEEDEGSQVKSRPTISAWSADSRKLYIVDEETGELIDTIDSASEVL